MKPLIGKLEGKSRLAVKEGLQTLPSGQGGGGGGGGAAAKPEVPKVLKGIADGSTGASGYLGGP